MSGPDTGVVVLADNGRGPVAGVVVEVRQGRLTVVTPSGTRETWPRDRVFMITDVVLPCQSAKVAAGNLKELAGRIESLASEADLAGAWELLTEEGPFKPDVLAGLLFGEESGLYKAAAVWAAESDGLYFKRGNDGSWEPVTRSAAESLLRERLARVREDRMLTEVHQAISARLDSGSSPDMSDRLVAKGISWLENLVYSADGGKDSKRAISLIRMLRGQEPPPEPEQCAFDYLVRLGVADPDEIVSIRRNGIGQDFGPVVEEDAVSIVRRSQSRLEGDRLDPAPGSGPLAIDDRTTRDVDDALMLEDAGGLLKVHILIADPTSLIELDSPTGQAGLSRASSLYVPTGTFPMFPKILSEDALSLSTEHETSMLDFVVTLADDGTQVDFDMRLVRGRLEARLTYEDVDRMLSGDEEGPFSDTLRRLERIATVLRDRRVAEGAVPLEKDEYQVKVVDGAPVVTRISYWSLSRRLVSEYMILACALAGRFSRKNDIPVVYRRQDPPDMDVSEKLKGLRPGSRAWFYSLLRTMKRGELSTIPGSHYSLGVVGYTQVTSPLRRFQDFLAHVQIKGFLSVGRAPVDSDTLVRMFAELEARSEVVARVEREARRYWTMKYLKGFEGKQVEGEVVYRAGSRVLVELDDTGLVLPVTAGGATPGSRLRLNVLDVDPRRDQAMLTVG